MSFDKPSIWRNKKYLEWLRTKPCAACGIMDGTVVGHHYGPHGIGIKASDAYTVPMCFDHHTEEHSGRHVMSYTAMLTASMSNLNEWLSKTSK